jgi:hypothetical protein
MTNPVLKLCSILSSGETGLAENTILSNCEPPFALLKEGAQGGQIIFAGA